jgi:hypothetical protein
VRVVSLCAKCGVWWRSKLCPDRSRGHETFFSLDLGLSIQPPIYPDPLLLVSQLPNNHPKSISGQFQSLISSWGIGDIISESIEVGSQFCGGHVLGDRDSGQCHGMLVIWICDDGFEMIDAVQRQLVVTFGRQVYRGWKGGSELITCDVAIDKLLFKSTQLTRAVLPVSGVGYSSVQSRQQRLLAVEV